MKWFTNIAMLTAAALLFAGCSTDGTDDRDYANDAFELVGDQTVWDFAREAQSVFIPFKTTVPASAWYIDAGDASWVSVTKISEDDRKGVMLSLSESEEPEVRSAVVKISAALSQYELTLRQLGYGPAILVDDKKVGNGGGTVEITVTTNIDVKIVGEPDYKSYDKTWLTVLNEGKPLSRALESYAYELFADINFDPFVRSAEITFGGADEEYEDVTAVCVVTQDVGAASDVEVNPDAVADTKVSVNGTTVNSCATQPRYLTDGNYSTDGTYSQYYNSNYESSNNSYGRGKIWPVTWTFTFTGNPTIDYFKFYGHTQNYGQPGAFSVSYKSSTNTSGTTILDSAGAGGSESDPLGNFGQASGVFEFRFPYSLENVTELTVTWYDGGGGQLACEEIEFWKDNSNTAALNTSLLEVFKDLSCSELREDVTYEKILALHKKSPFMAQEVAARMYDGSFPTFNDEKENEFRIQSYDAYSEVSNMRKVYVTRIYSPFDNPTGIYVKAGETIFLCLDKVPAGQTVSLGIAGKDSGYDRPWYTGFAQSRELRAGINEITANFDGLCFVVNTAKNLTSASEAVKVHFLPGYGIVDGYADVHRHGDAEFRALLDAAQFEFFFMKGRNICFYMHTAALKTYRTGTGADGVMSALDAWDQIVGWQQELMGISKDLSTSNSNWWGHDWDRMIDETHFNNHILAISNQDGNYMNAADYRINFAVSNGLPKIITRNRLLQTSDNSWGPAHESGHVNQRAINWESTTESSNNLFSNYILYRMGKFGSRGKTVTQLGEEYARGRAWYELGTKGTDEDYKGEDPEIHMRMNWQLWNYFHKCGFDVDFWPKVFELCRTKYLLPNDIRAILYSETNDPGTCQLMFAKAVCEAAKMDLTEFFDAWGFFKTVNNVTYTQYYTVKYNVTSTMVNEFKTWASLQGWQAAPPIQYIEDRDTAASGFYSAAERTTNEIGDKYSDYGYYTIFRDQLKITGTPTYSLSGSTYTISGGENIVAIELREAGSGSTLGALKYFSNLSSFTVPSDVISAATLQTLKVYAVQCDGERIALSSK